MGCEWRIWRLDGAGTTVILGSRRGAVPRFLYWGAALPAQTDPEAVAMARTEARNPHSALQEPESPSLAPVSGWGFWGMPALALRRGDGRATLRPVLDDVAVAEGALRFRLRDDAFGAMLDISVALDGETGVLSFDTVLENRGDDAVVVDWCASAAVELPDRVGELLTFEGAWCMEFQERRAAIPVGAFVRENRRGRTSHDSNPCIIVGEPGFGDETGAVWAFHLGWSGNHRLSVERLNEGTVLVQLGDLPFPGEVSLDPGGRFRAPTAYALWSGDGLNGVMRRTHDHVRRRIHPRGPDIPVRRVHLNTWEAVYFDHDWDGLTALAEAAAAVGVERFVLDDGWFRGRDHDRAGLGDWRPDPRKYPDGLGPLAERVASLGMEFGLWVEPEMVNPDSDLYRAHPDWCLHLDDAPRPEGRNQLVLDLTRDDVLDYLFEALDALLSAHPIGYLKWDHNRDIAPPVSGSGAPVARRQVLGHYALLDRLRAAHPKVEIESCASGGGRIDWEILSRTERVWTSDSNDALDRLFIQRGFSLFYPPETMGAHIGPDRCHTSGRRLDLAFRAATAFFGHFGIEWDIRTLSEEARAELAAAVAAHKRHRALLHGGVAVRLPLPSDRAVGRGVVARDRGEAIFGISTLAFAHAPLTARLAGLDPDAAYRVRAIAPSSSSVLARLPEPIRPSGEGTVLPGRVLADGGFRLLMQEPAQALLLHCERVS